MVERLRRVRSHNIHWPYGDPHLYRKEIVRLSIRKEVLTHASRSHSVSPTSRPTLNLPDQRLNSPAPEAEAPPSTTPPNTPLIHPLPVPVDDPLPIPVDDPLPLTPQSPPPPHLPPIGTEPPAMHPPPPQPVLRGFIFGVPGVNNFYADRVPSPVPTEIDEAEYEEPDTALNASPSPPSVANSSRPVAIDPADAVARGLNFAVEEDHNQPHQFPIPRQDTFYCVRWEQPPRN
ncbi:hypothetical protein SISNIDRAFT_469987 [Sistotremastrum niveocremeum HHB9708]|uniref:Uncharacterized protein n=2 Tax=Sistotremastraceae TaxID=3402574 RepID=A0A164PH97_9AGAM|nr:hypothetical protein SISNIDRAFT_469987 [Sistotremastrum niveocremeum HHB9708]KZT40714.1 hypothetical protein SISSUDRAFT_1031732 [Sistotremastrum suecicum HHB10207 ss-3]